MHDFARDHVAWETQACNIEILHLFLISRKPDRVSTVCHMCPSSMFESFCHASIAFDVQK